MRICLIADSGTASFVESTARGPQGSLDFFAAPLPRAPGEAWPPADLYLLEAETFLVLEPERRPRPCFLYGPERHMRAGFQAGCSDYLREPWGWGELEARALKGGRLAMDLGGRRLECGEEGFLLDGQALELSEAEGILAKTLMANPGFPVSRQALETALWGVPKPNSRALDVHLANLRRKLKLVSPELPDHLRTSRGRGYYFLGRPCG